MTTQRSLFRQASIYAISQVGARAIPFLLLPVMTRFLTPADYGVVTMFLFLSVLLEPLLGLSLNGAITVKFYDRSVDLARYLGSGLVLASLLGVMAILAAVVLGGSISTLTGVPQVWILLVVPLVLARVVFNNLLALLRVREQPARFGLFDNAETAALLVLAIVFVVVLGLSWPGRLAAELIGSLGFAAVAIAYLRNVRSVRFELNGSDVRDLARFGIPLIPHAIGAVLLVQADRVLITNMVSIDETGLYAVGFQVALVVQLVADAFNNAYAPWLFRQLESITPAAKRRLVRATYKQMGGFAALAVAAAAVLPAFAATVLGGDFARSTQFIGWFVLAFFFSSGYYMVTNYIFFAQKTRWLAVITFTVAIINIPLTFLLITRNGAVGAAQSLALSYGLYWTLTWIASNRSFPMPWISALLPTTESES